MPERTYNLHTSLRLWSSADLDLIQKWNLLDVSSLQMFSDKTSQQMHIIKCIPCSGSALNVTVQYIFRKLHATVTALKTCSRYTTIYLREHWFPIRSDPVGTMIRATMPHRMGQWHWCIACRGSGCWQGVYVTVSCYRLVGRLENIREKDLTYLFDSKRWASLST